MKWVMAAQGGMAVQIGGEDDSAITRLMVTLQAARSTAVQCARTAARIADRSDEQPLVMAA